MTDEIRTEIDSPDAASAEQFLFGDAEDAEVAGGQDTIGETPGEGDAPDDPAELEEQGDDGEQTCPAGSESPEDLKIVLSIRGGRAVIGVQQPSADPHIEPFDGFDLLALALQVPSVVERARARWEEALKYPDYEKPAPPARRRARRQQETDRVVTTGADTEREQPETPRLF